MTPGHAMDNFVLVIAQEIAQRHGLKINVDLETHTIDFLDGTDEQQRAAALEIDEKLGDYAA